MRSTEFPSSETGVLPFTVHDAPQQVPLWAVEDSGDQCHAWYSDLA